MRAWQTSPEGPPEAKLKKKKCGSGRRAAGPPAKNLKIPMFFEVFAGFGGHTI